MNQEPLFYIEREEGEKAGPYDLVQMAGLLRKKIITPETMTCLKGTEDWRAFSWQPHYSVVREIPSDAVSNRVEELEEKALAARSGLIPLPSRETVMKLGGLLCGSILVGLGSFIMAWLDQTTGHCLMAAGAAAVMVASCLIYARMMDEDYWTLATIFFIPGGDIYYFISNIWQYFTLFCVKYLGAAMFAGAALGVAMHSAH